MNRIRWAISILGALIFVTGLVQSVSMFPVVVSWDDGFTLFVLGITIVGFLMMVVPIKINRKVNYKRYSI